MKFETYTAGVLCVAAALPDPPFEFMDGATPTGFDVELMQAICVDLGLEWRLVPYTGADFNGIFDGLANGSAGLRCVWRDDHARTPGRRHILRPLYRVRPESRLQRQEIATSAFH